MYDADVMPTTGRQRILARKAALWNERSSWLDHWREIAEYQQPRMGRFLASDTNKGTKKHGSILDNVASFGVRTLAAGMMSGMTSPARPWFKLELDDRELLEHGPVKAWLHEVSSTMRRVFAKSNTYRSLHGMYAELGLFGTATSIVLPNYDNVLHHYPLSCGEYALATNTEGQVDTVVREFRMTVAQCVETFGAKQCSVTIRNLWDRGAYDQWVDIVHVIEPRRERDVSKLDAQNMRYASIYLEPGRENHDLYLRESGFERFRALSPRWDVTSNDVYGDSPGMACLGDVKQLQHEQVRKGTAIDYQVNPPLQVPTEYKGDSKSRLPGGVMYVNQSGPNGGVRSAFEVNLNLQHLREDIFDIRDRIQSAYYTDLFLMLANDTRSGVTATEVAERHEEKLLMLGPVLERLHNELLSPMIDMTFDDCMKAGILPDPPPELAGMELNVEFISVLAQAQRAVAAAGMDRLLGSVATMAGIWPEARHKIDALQVVDEYAEMWGVPPRIVRADDDAEQIIAAEQQAAQAAQAAEAAPALADTAKTAGEVDTGGVQDVMNLFAGYNSPSASEV